MKESEKYIKMTERAYDEASQEFVGEQWDNYQDIVRPNLEFFVKLLPKNGKVLDIGCGVGRDSHYFTSNGFETVGIDFSKRMVEEARKRVSKAEFFKMDMRKLNFEDETFDGIWATAALLHVPKNDISKALREIIRVLKKGGILFIGTIEGEGEKIIEEPQYGKDFKRLFSFFSEGEVLNELKKLKMEIIKSGVVFEGKHKWINIYARKR